jgi:hypothetical protein
MEEGQNSSCAVKNCAEFGKYRCGQCRIVFYCSHVHQKEHWPMHKTECKKARLSASGSLSASGQVNNKITGEVGEQRMCRCMFCGLELRLKSEEEAIQHMEVCPALQEQLSSKDQFTVPSVVKEQMKKNDPSFPPFK